MSGRLAATLLIAAACSAPPAAGGGEAGFVEVPAAVTAGPRDPMRVFWSYHPADADAGDAPVAFVWNGGPGLATSGHLAVDGVGPLALDVDGAPIANPASWTRFAHVVAIDEPLAGWSYGVGAFDGCAPGPAYVADAAAAVATMLEFLDGHPALRTRRVVVVGHGTGATRAALALYLLRHHGEPAGLIARDAVPWLAARIAAHDAATPVTRQFGWQVLLQPVFWGARQYTFQAGFLRGDPDFAAFLAPASGLDPFDVRQPAGANAARVAVVAAALRDPARVAALLDIAPAAVPRLPAAARGAAFRLFDRASPSAVADAERSLTAALGALPATDAYWLPEQTACPDGDGDDATATVFAAMLTEVASFVSNARYDAVVYTEAIAPLLSATDLDVDVVADQPAAAARPGELALRRGPAAYRVRFPTYAAGHHVARAAAGELADDVAAWLVATGAR